METDYTKWSFKNKLWAALAACGSLAVLAYPPWFFRAQSFRAWIFEARCPVGSMPAASGSRSWPS